jgi:hypothetical protein
MFLLDLFPFLSLFIYYFLFYKESGVCFLMILFAKIVQCCWQMNEWVLVMDGIILIGKPKHFGKNLCQCPFIQDRPWIDPHLCFERLATNHLNFGAACYSILFSIHQRCQKVWHTPNTVLFTSLESARWQDTFLFKLLPNIKTAVSAFVHESWVLLNGCEIWYSWVWLQFFILLQFWVKLDNNNWHFTCMKT